MAFVNSFGKLISYSCEELIEELQEDIAEFGEDLIVNVIIQKHDGVILFKDYNFIDDDTFTDFELADNEKIIPIKATELLKCYIKENEIEIL